MFELYIWLLIFGRLEKCERVERKYVDLSLSSHLKPLFSIFLKAWETVFKPKQALWAILQNASKSYFDY